MSSKVLQVRAAVLSHYEQVARGAQGQGGHRGRLHRIVPAVCRRVRIMAMKRAARLGESAVIGVPAQRAVALLLAGGLAMLFMRARHFEPTERAIQWPDALGLGLFTAVGVDRALETGSPALVAVLMGLVTGVFGGVLRDMVCNEIPTAFRDHRPYAVCAFAGGWVYVGLLVAQAPGPVALLACLVVTAGLRGLALWRDWQLPAWQS